MRRERVAEVADAGIFPNATRARNASRYLLAIPFSDFRRLLAAHIPGGARGRRHVSVPGFADERRAAGVAIPIRPAERPGAAAEAEDRAGRLPRHHRGSRAGDRVHKRRRKTARGGEKPAFPHIPSLCHRIYR